MTPRSGSNEAIASVTEVSSVFALSTGTSYREAAAATAVSVMTRLRPCGESSRVMTARSSCCESASRRRLGTAASGLPAKTSLKPLTNAPSIGEGFGIVEPHLKCRQCRRAVLTGGNPFAPRRGVADDGSAQHCRHLVPRRIVQPQDGSHTVIDLSRAEHIHPGDAEGFSHRGIHGVWASGNGGDAYGGWKAQSPPVGEL